jgi:hypothetical protein
VHRRLRRGRHTAASASIVALILTATALTACGNDDGEETTTVTKQVQGPTGPTGPSGVGSAAPTRKEAVAVVKDFYRLLNSYRYREAWAFVPPQVRAEAGGYANWKSGYRANVRSSPSNIGVDSIGANRAVVALDLDAIDVDACTGKNVKQVFTGTWTLKAASGGWEPVDATFEKVSGATPTLRESECGGEPTPPPGGPAAECTRGYSPCLRPASDYDCEGGDGDGPEYVSGPVQVTGTDPYDLDRDGNGVGCE